MRGYTTAGDFLQNYQPNLSGCLILDVSMPGMDGMELQQHLAEKHVRIPIIFITGHGDIPLSVQAMKAGALDFIEKPFDNALLLRRVQEAFALDLHRRKYEALNATTSNRTEHGDRARVTLQSIGDAVITTDNNGLVEFLNPPAERLTGWSEVDAHGQSVEKIFDVIDDHSGEPIEQLVSRYLQSGQAVTFEHGRSLRTRDGNQVAIEFTSAPILDGRGERLGTVIVSKDVSKQRQAVLELAHRAAHDPLTNLMNRREFEKRLESAVIGAKLHGAHHVLCYVDLDQFKAVNDTAGHAAGDMLLQQVGALFVEQVRDRDAVARVGGDEFAMLLANCRIEKALEIAESLLAELRDYRFLSGEHVFQLGASIGLTEITHASENAAECIAQADAASYTAKKLGRNRIHTYEADGCITHGQNRPKMPATCLSAALERESFALFGQPIVPLIDSPRSPIRHEVLLRLLDANGEIILPSAFIPTAERKGLMVTVDRWVIRMSFKHYSELFSAMPNTEFAINLSAESINDPSFPAYVRAQFAQWTLPPERICFEIAETTALRNIPLTRRFMDELKKDGCRFALDHFGNGLSSFSILKKLPIDYLKIEGSLIRNILQSQVDQATVAAINQIGHTIGIRTIAAWAESAAIITRLIDLGVDDAQGYAVRAPSLLESRSACV